MAVFYYQSELFGRIVSNSNTVVYKVYLSFILAACKALNSLQTVQQTLHYMTCLFSCLLDSRVNSRRTGGSAAAARTGIWQGSDGSELGVQHVDGAKEGEKTVVALNRSRMEEYVNR